MKLEDILAICRKIHEPLRLRGLQSAKFNKENVCKGILKQSYLCMQACVDVNIYKAQKTLLFLYTWREILDIHEIKIKITDFKNSRVLRNI